MAALDAFTIVVPTRDDPAKCCQVLENVVADNLQAKLPLNLVFLVNDTSADACTHLQEAVSNPRFASLRPRLLRAARNHPTVEENIRHTLGENLDAVAEHFVIVGNSDHVELAGLRGALAHVDANQLDLLLVGVINREVHEGKAVRQLYTTPRHLNPKSRLSPDSCHGKDVFSQAMTDYGPVDYLAFIGCQIYSKKFFRELCRVQAELPEPLYSIPVGTLELSLRQDWKVGFFPEVVVTRIDHLQYGAASAQQPPDWWVFRSRTDRGLSRHILLSVISNSLHLSDAAFGVLVNSQIVATPRGCPQYLFSNFLFTFVEQTTNIIRFAPQDPALRFSASEQRDIVGFGKRLGETEIGLTADHRTLISTWLQHFGVVGDYSQPQKIQELLAATEAVLGLLNMRPGMERWVAQLL